MLGLTSSPFSLFPLSPTPPSLQATAVIGMLERRAGDMFRKHLERLVGAACHPDPSAPPGANPRLLDTLTFLTDLGK